MKNKGLFRILSLFVLFVSCTVLPAFAQPASDKDLPVEQPTYSKDPLERFNRSMFKFNETIDRYLMKPIATLYNAIIPKPLNQGIHNIFLNVNEVPIIANDILQFNFFQMTKDVWRTAINTTLGIGGLFDIAERMHKPLPYRTNDFGLTLASWGFVNSTYVVFPFWGPNTIRDGIGLPVDYYGFSLYPYIEPVWTRWGVYAWSVVDGRAQLLRFQPVYEEAAVDKYVFVRNAYMQRRAYLINQNKHLGYLEQNAQ